MTQLVHHVERQQLIGGGDVLVFDWVAVLVLSVDDHPAQGTDGQQCCESRQVDPHGAVREEKHA